MAEMEKKKQRHMFEFAVANFYTENQNPCGGRNRFPAAAEIEKMWSQLKFEPNRGTGPHRFTPSSF